MVHPGAHMTFRVPDKKMKEGVKPLPTTWHTYRNKHVRGMANFAPKVKHADTHTCYAALRVPFTPTCVLLPCRSSVTLLLYAAVRVLLRQAKRGVSRSCASIPACMYVEFAPLSLENRRMTYMTYMAVKGLARKEEDC